MNRRTLPTSALFFVLVLAGGFAALIVGLVAQESRRSVDLTPAAIVDGSFTAAVDAQFEAVHPLRGPAVSLSAAISFALLAEAPGEAVAGFAGWLFSLEEFARYPDDDRRLDERIGQIVAARTELRERDIELAVVLVPSKARLRPDLLRARWRAQAQHPRYDSAVERLRERGVPVVDLRRALSSVGSSPGSGTPLFFARDTHWTPEGARQAARAIAESLRDLPALSGLDRTEYERVSDRILSVPGDLMNFMPLGDRLREVFSLPLEEARQFRIVPSGDESGALGLFDELVIPVALVGTSYSRNERWGFEGALKVELGLDLLNVAAVGEGPFAPMREYLSGPVPGEIPPRLVIWEIPERYLTLPQ